MKEEWVPVKKLCVEHGLNPEQQRSKLVTHGKQFETKLLTKKGVDGKNYKMLCIKKEDVAAYLEFAKTYVRGPYQKRER